MRDHITGLALAQTDVLPVPLRNALLTGRPDNATPVVFALLHGFKISKDNKAPHTKERLLAVTRDAVLVYDEAGHLKRSIRHEDIDTVALEALALEEAVAPAEAPAVVARGNQTAAAVEQNSLATLSASLARDSSNTPQHTPRTPKSPSLMKKKVGFQGGTSPRVGTDAAAVSSSLKPSVSFSFEPPAATPPPHHNLSVDNTAAGSASVGAPDFSQNQSKKMNGENGGESIAQAALPGAEPPGWYRVAIVAAAKKGYDICLSVPHTRRLRSQLSQLTRAMAVLKRAQLLARAKQVCTTRPDEDSDVIVGEFLDKELNISVMDADEVFEIEDPQDPSHQQAYVTAANSPGPRQVFWPDRFLNLKKVRGAAQVLVPPTLEVVMPGDAAEKQRGQDPKLQVEEVIGELLGELHQYEGESWAARNIISADCAVRRATAIDGELRMRTLVHDLKIFVHEREVENRVRKARADAAMLVALEHKERVAKEMVDKRRNHTKEVAQLREAATEAERRGKSVVEECDNIRTQTIQMRRDREDEIAALNTACNAVEKQLEFVSQSQMSVEELAEKVAAAREERARAEHRLRIAEADRDAAEELKDDKRVVESECSDLQKSVLEHRTTRRAAERERSQMSQAMDTLIAQKARAAADAERITHDVDSIKKKIEESRRERADVLAKRRQLQERCRLLEKERLVVQDMKREAMIHQSIAESVRSASIAANEEAAAGRAVLEQELSTMQENLRSLSTQSQSQRMITNAATLGSTTSPTHNDGLGVGNNAASSETPLSPLAQRLYNTYLRNTNEPALMSSSSASGSPNGGGLHTDRSMPQQHGRPGSSGYPRPSSASVGSTGLVNSTRGGSAGASAARPTTASSGHPSVPSLGLHRYGGAGGSVGAAGGSGNGNRAFGNGTDATTGAGDSGSASTPLSAQQRRTERHAPHQARPTMIGPDSTSGTAYAGGVAPLGERNDSSLYGVPAAPSVPQSLVSPSASAIHRDPSVRSHLPSSSPLGVGMTGGRGAISSGVGAGSSGPLGLSQTASWEQSGDALSPLGRLAAQGAADGPSPLPQNPADAARRSDVSL